MSEHGWIENPEAVGNPDETPILHASQGLVALLNPCRNVLANGDWCGGVNGWHHDECPKDAR